MPNDGLPPSPPAPSPTPAPYLPPQTHPPQTEPPRGDRTVAELEKQIREVNAEAAHHRITARNAGEQIERLQGQITEIQQRTAGEVQAAKAPLESRLAKMNARTIDSEIRAEALQSGLQDADLIGLPVFDRSGIAIDEDGNVSGVKEAVAKFKAAKPQYFAAPANGQRQGAPTQDLSGRRQSAPRNDPPPPSDTPANVDTRGMSDADYARWKSGRSQRLSGR